ncbi:hypothetical protein D9758_017560 [Tetrapyrgos nigripes]|uniref:Adenosine deaminase domain-containing protein n=1 Tax=Tetrapyrgos nigripes TaxID=182062 RepID=A0A8H5FFB1_9AGAR|nr:hypothetical protein D9758_017560 [Tetrapyrgos nigripes]
MTSNIENPINNDSDIRGRAALALSSLSPSQLTFLQNLPKAELHAHLNGCIPLKTIKELVDEYVMEVDNDASVFTTTPSGSGSASEPTTTPRPPKHPLTKTEILSGYSLLEKFDSELDDIHAFFAPFAIIYALTNTKGRLRKATRAVLEGFLGSADGNDDRDSNSNISMTPPQAAYLELRTTPRTTSDMSRLEYLETVLDEVERYPKDRMGGLIVSLDRKMTLDVVREVVDLAVGLKTGKRRVIGLDLCGDPLAGNMYSPLLTQCFQDARNAGLGITLHIAETAQNPSPESIHLLRAFIPDRLGHATFLDEEAREVVFDGNGHGHEEGKRKIGVEVCLSSNLICKTVPTLEDHHIRYYLERDHPIAICTDDTLPFRTSLLAEYALLLASAPWGLGMSEGEVERVARGGWGMRFL